VYVAAGIVLLSLSLSLSYCVSLLCFVRFFTACFWRNKDAYNPYNLNYNHSR